MAEIITVTGELTADESRAMVLRGSSPTKKGTWLLNTLNAQIESDLVWAKADAVKDKPLSEIETKLK